MITITPEAQTHIQSLIREEGNPDLRLRLAVSGGGCSGFQYHFSLDGETTPDDQIFECVVIDEVSLSLVDGAIVDYVEDLMGASFVIRNPNATTSCGCGNSFAI